MTQPGQPCSSPSVSPTSLSIASGGGSGTVTVSGRSDCSWSVSDNRSWLTSNRTTVSGGQSVTITAVANTGSSSRTGMVTIGGRSVSVTQPGQPCSTPSVSPTSVSIVSGGGSGTVTVSGRTDCNWSVSDNETWITATPSTVTGGGTVTVTVSANAGSSARTGTVTIGGLSVSVSQSGQVCPTSPSGVSPTSVSFVAAGGDAGVTVSGRSDCSWSVSANRSWLTVTSSPVSGGGSVTITAAANSPTTATANIGSSTRTGTVTIGGLSVNVVQTGAVQPCPTGPDGLGWIGDHFESNTRGFTLVRTTVAGRSDCTWPVSSTVDWIKIYYAKSGTLSGGGYLGFSVARNTGVVREGAITIGTRTLRISQEGALNSPPTANAGFDRTVEVGSDVTLNGTATDPDLDGSTPIGEIVDPIAELTYHWTQVKGPSVLTGQSGHSVTFIAPATQSDAELEFSFTVTDAHGAESSDNVTVTVRGQVLTGHRDRLLADWAQRKGYGSDVCAAWDSLDATAQEVFIWNTHRLHRSNMLPEVDELHAIYGKQNPDNLDTDCGGGEYNRTFMVATPTLRDKFIAVYEGDSEVFPAWEITGDLACSVPGKDCPHWPFHRQIETHGGHPRGQINFFLSPQHVRVDRSYYLGSQYCSTAGLSITDDAACTKERCNCGVDGLCPLDDGVCNRPNLFSDKIYSYYTVEEEERGPVGHKLTIENDLMFEMDQDYNRLSRLDFHDSAPSCNSMTATYASNYGAPGWDWQPTRTTACTSAAGAVAAFAATALESEDVLDTRSVSVIGSGDASTGTQIRAAHVMALRTRVDELRLSVGLAAFIWTDPVLIAGVTPIKAVHLTELRGALNTIYATRGRETPPYTDGEPVIGITLIKTIHLSEIDVALQALTDSSGGLLP